MYVEKKNNGAGSVVIVNEGISLFLELILAVN
jgi:hypothetical protein